MDHKNTVALAISLQMQSKYFNPIKKIGVGLPYFT